MRKARCTYRWSSLSVRSGLRLAFFFRALVVFSFAVVTLGLLGPAARAQNIFDCSSFASSGTCGVGSGQEFGSYYPLSGDAIDFVPAGSTHNGNALFYKTAVNVQGFTSTFTFIPNGFNLSFVLNNCNQSGCGSGKGPTFAAGAGCEGGFYQAFDGPPYPNNVFALMLDSYSPLTNGANFTYSSAQIYQTNQSPCLPNDTGPNYYPTNKVSTSPVNLTRGSAPSTTGDTYSATVSYNGTTLTLSMYDVTAGGSCPGATCFTQSWPVYIPSIVGGTTAYVGLTSGIGLTTTHPLYVSSFSYTVNPSSGPPTTTLANMYANAGGTVTAADPLYSPAPERYSGTQAVTLTSSTANSYICYVLAASPPALMPQTNNDGTCAQGTIYTGPITISSSQTLYSMASTHSLSPPSALTIGAYTIGGLPAASTPTFSLVAGTYTGAQNITISTSSSGAVICYNTTGSPATNGATGCTTGTLYTGSVTVSSNETLYAIAGGTEYDDSPVGSASYVIQNVTQNSVATPTFSPAAGTYSSQQSIAISDATSGAAIYYTTDGSTPTTSSTVYNGPITVSSTETLKAIAAVTGDSNSAIASAAYTITPQPFFTLTASPTSLTGTASEQGTVTLTVTPGNGFGSAVSFACSGLPAGATCAFSPATVTPSGSPATTQLTISGSVQSSASQPGPRPFFPLTALAMTVCLFGWRNRRGWHHWLLLAIIGTGLGLLFGCSGTSGTPPVPTTVTTPTISTVIVTATSGTLQQTATITLTVN
jgi:hypothetical protein